MSINIRLLVNLLLLNADCECQHPSPKEVEKHDMSKGYVKICINQQLVHEKGWQLNIVHDMADSLHQPLLDVEYRRL